MYQWRIAGLAVLTVGLGACDGVVSELTGAETAPSLLPAFDHAPSVSSFSCEPAPAGAPMTELCRWTVSGTQGEPVSCTLQVSGAERAEYPLSDCLTAQSQSHTFAAPGSYTVEITVRDPAGNHSTASLVVTVAQPNRRPEITAFAASPAQGLVPLAARLSWAISDADGDALTCAIDLGGDGTVEYSLPDCTSALTQAHTFLSAGVTDLVLTVTDERGLSSTRAATVSAKVPVGDLRVTRAEWGQTVIAANPRLVAGKPALLRVYVVADRANIAGAVVKAEGFRGAVSLGVLPLTGPATPPIAEDPANLAQQYRATVPAAWVAAGLEVRIAVDPADALPETDEANNGLALTPLVGAGTVLAFTAVPVIHQGVTASTPGVDEVLAQIWPLKEVSSQTRAPYTFSGLLSSTGTSGWGQLLGELSSVRAADGSERYYYGFVDSGYGSGIAGLGYVGQPVAIGRDDSLQTVAHEVGHNLGRNHAPCGGVSGADSSYPYAGAKIGSQGYDVSSGRLIAASAAYDLMSYCHPSWVSDYNYRAVQSFLESHPPQALVLPPPQEDLLLVSGAIVEGAVSLRPLQRLVGSRSKPVEGPYTLRLFTARGAIEVPFEVHTVGDAEGEAHFSLLLPHPGALRALEVSYGGRVLFAQAARPAPAGRDGFTLVDLGDELVLTWDPGAYPHASVAHLGEGGRTTLALFLTGGVAAVRTDGLARGGSFEVSLSDGLNPVRLVRSR